MVNMTRQMEEESENPGKLHDDDGAINEWLGNDEDFYGSDENEVVTRESDNTYMDALKISQELAMMLNISS